MSVTFNNVIFTNADAAVGAIVLLPPLLTGFVGTSLTSQLGVTTATVNGTVGAPGSTASVSLNAVGLALNDPTSTYVGFSNNNGALVYYFSVVGTNGITGQAVSVGVAVSAEGVPGLVGLNTLGIDTSATSAPADPALIGGGTFGAPVFQSATANGNTVTLAYNEALSTTGPLPGSFTVAANGTATAVTGVAVSGQTVVLTLATPVANGQVVTVGYTDPSLGNDVDAIQDRAGSDAPSLLLAIATNNTPQALGPVLQTASVTGSTLKLAYNEALSSLGPLASSFAVTAGGAAVTVTGATVVGQNVFLTLATPVTSGQAVTVGYADFSTGNDVFAVQDLAGNDAATLPATAVTNNTAQASGPTFQSASANGTSVTLAYNKVLSPVGPNANAFAVTIGGTAATVTAATVVGQDVVLTLATPVANGQTVTVAYTDPTTGNDAKAIQDVAGNDAATLSPAVATNDTPVSLAAGPTFQSATVDGATLTLAYNEVLSPVGPTAGSFAVTVGGIDANVTGAIVVGQNVVLTLGTAATPGQAVTVGYTDPSTGNDPNAIQDLAGNDAASLPSTTGATNNTSATPAVGPLFQSASADGSTVTLVYNEALSPVGPATGSFAVTAGSTSATVTGATVAGQTVVLTLSTPVTSGQTVTVGYTDPGIGNDPNAIQDLAGNDAASLSATTTATNNTAQENGPELQYASANGSKVTLAYNKALSANGPTIGSFAVTAGGTAATVTAATVVDQTVVLTLATPVTSGQAVTVGYKDPTTDNDSNAIQDSIGNDAASFPGTTIATNNTPQVAGPTFQSASADGASVTLAYNVPLSTTGPLPGAFTVTANGIAATVTAAAVVDQTVVLTLATPVASGQTVTVAYADPTTSNDANAIQDAAGNDAVSLPGTTVATNNTPQGAGPAFQSTTANGTSVTLAYNEPLSTTGPLPGSFAVKAGGNAATITSAAVVGQTVVLTLATPVTSGQAVTVGYTDPTAGNDASAIQDLAGNDAATLPATTIATNDTAQAAGPTFQSATANGNTVTLAYNEPLSTTGPTTGAFAVKVDGIATTVTGATVVGQNVALTLATPVVSGQTVTVTYTDPTAGNDASAIQDVAGNDAASLAAIAATNNSATTGGTDPAGGSTGTGTGTGTGTSTRGNTSSGGLTGTGTSSISGASGGTTTITTNPDGSITVVTTLEDGSATTLTLAQGSAYSVGTGAAQGDVVSVDPEASFTGRGQFTVSGHVASDSGVTSVAISAVVDGAATPTTLGTATVASDGSYSFVDRVDAHLQGFITATATDGRGATTAVQAPYSLQAGMTGTGFVAEQDRYLPDGSEQVSTSLSRNAQTRRVDIVGSGQTFSDDQVHVFNNNGGPTNTFIFNPGHGQDVINLFRANGVDHDTLSLNSDNGSVTLADVLQNTKNVSGGVMITDPTTGDNIRLTGVSKAELKANPSDIVFHA